MMDSEVSSSEASSVVDAVKKRSRKQIKPVKVVDLETGLMENKLRNIVQQELVDEGIDQQIMERDVQYLPAIHGCKPLDLSRRKLKRTYEESESSGQVTIASVAVEISQPKGDQSAGRCRSGPKPSWQDSLTSAHLTLDNKLQLSPAACQGDNQKGENGSLKKLVAISGSKSETRASSSSSSLPDSTGSDSRSSSANCCHICSREFCNKYFLEAHVAKKHGIATIPAIASGCQYSQKDGKRDQKNQPVLPSHWLLPSRIQSVSNREINLRSCGIPFVESSDHLHAPALMIPTATVGTETLPFASKALEVNYKKAVNGTPAAAAGSLAANYTKIEEGLGQALINQQQQPEMNAQYRPAGQQPGAVPGNYSDVTMLRLMLSVYHRLDNKNQPAINPAGQSSSQLPVSLVGSDTSTPPLNAPASPPLLCMVCQQMFIVAEEFLNHFKSEHGEGSPMYMILPSSTSRTNASTPVARRSALVPGFSSATQTVRLTQPAATPSHSDSSFPYLAAAGPNDGEGNSSKKKTPPQLLKIPKKRLGALQARSYCYVCNKELCNKYFLKTHMLKMHGVIMEPSAVSVPMNYSKAANFPATPGFETVNALLEAHIVDLLNATGPQLSNAARGKVPNIHLGKDNNKHQQQDCHAWDFPSTLASSSKTTGSSTSSNSSAHDEVEELKIESPESATSPVAFHGKLHILQSLLDGSQQATSVQQTFKTRTASNVAR